VRRAAAIGIALALVLFGCGGGEATDTGSEPETAGVGDTQTVQTDAGEKITLAVLEVDDPAEAVDPSYNAEPHLDAGNRWVRVRVRIDNPSNEPVIGLTDTFEVRDSEGQAFASDPDPALFKPFLGQGGNEFTVPPHGKRIGYVGFQLPDGAALESFDFTSVATGESRTWSIP
jgi:hypothetical protein